MTDLVNLRTLVKDTLMKARKSEENGCLIQASDLYEAVFDQISELMNLEKTTSRLHIYQRHLDRVHSRLEELRTQFDYHNSHGCLLDKITIADGATNMGYERIFGKYLTNSVKEVLIYEPYFIRRSHMKNFMHFIELVVRKCSNICYIRLTAMPIGAEACQQRAALINIRSCLATKNIDFHYRFIENFDDHMIVLNTGYIIRSNYGLNYFQSTSTPFTLGICDYDFRKCRETTIAIWRTCSYAKEIPDTKQQ